MSSLQGIFPFDLLQQGDGADFLASPELPPDAAQWRSVLTGSGPTQREVDEARELFRAAGHRDVRSYLVHYLRLDVILTQKATVALMRSFRETTGVHPVDAAKYTVSSLASYASHLRLYRDARPAMYFVNHPVYYSMIKTAQRGGLTACYRTGCGRDLDTSLYTDEGPDDAAGRRRLFDINSHHFTDGDTLPANHAVYPDIVSLYGSGERPLLVLRVPLAAVAVPAVDRSAVGLLRPPSARPR